MVYQELIFHIYFKLQFCLYKKLFRVDYLDSFGRTRRCVKKDLPSYKQQDEQLKAQSYTNFVKSEAEEKTDQSQPPNASLESKSNYDAMQERRKMWEQEEEVSMQKSKLHYQDILYQGIFFPIFLLGRSRFTRRFLPHSTLYVTNHILSNLSVNLCLMVS